MATKTDERCFYLLETDYLYLREFQPAGFKFAQLDWIKLFQLDADDGELRRTVEVIASHVDGHEDRTVVLRSRAVEDSNHFEFAHNWVWLSGGSDGRIEGVSDPSRSYSAASSRRTTSFFAPAENQRPLSYPVPFLNAIHGFMTR